jgi:hypothetical protein
MKKISILSFIWVCSLVVTACSGMTGVTSSSGKTPLASATPANANATASQSIIATTAAPSPAAVAATPSPIIASCGLLNSYDIASLFTQARTETQPSQPQESQVSHPIFSTAKAQGSEVTCAVYSFINPDVKDMRLLQINYWIDIPDPSASSSWEQAWTQLKSEGGKEISGIGQAAYFDNGQLTLQQNGIYITIKVIGPAMNAVANAGNDPQLNVEKFVAQDMLNKLQ